MTPKELLDTAIDPALILLSGTGIKKTDTARVLMLAIAGQESGWTHRIQVGGPAHSFWQFEQGGGVVGVLSHPASKDKIVQVCGRLGVPCLPATVYMAMIDNDVLAACMARLLLYTDPAPLPAVGDVDGGWAYYQRNWRPGMPHPEAWPARYATALSLIN